MAAQYTFAVKAMTGAGWSQASSPSVAATPVAEPQPTITITGSREGRQVVMAGATAGMGMGAVVTPWWRPAGRPEFTPGNRQILVSLDGTFSWGRTSRKTTRVYVKTPDGSVPSNTVVIQAR